MININSLTFDLPIQYKNLKFIPVTMKDYFPINTYAQCLTLDKNSIPDPKIISMTNLEYIFYESERNIEETPYILWFDRLLALCTKTDKPEESMATYGYDKKGKPIFEINEEYYNSEDFENIKNIIAQQNLIELIDENISKEVRDSLEEAREFKRRLTGGSASIEDYMIALAVATGWTLDYIYSLTVRKFTKAIARMNSLIHYKIYLAASLSGFVEFRDKSVIQHWLSNLDDEDKYSDVSIDMKEMEDKISFESAKKGAQ